MKIETKQGSATSPRPSGSGTLTRGVIIAHLCNNKSAWGAGFVLAVNELSLAAKLAYKELCKHYNGEAPLGITQFVEVQPDLFIANMIAQNGVDKSIGDCLVDYAALEKCLTKVFSRAAALRCDVHIPSGIGSGLAGGDEQKIHDIIKTLAADSRFRVDDPVQEPTVTLWEFDDTTAASYVGKPAASKQDMVAGAFGLADAVGNRYGDDFDNILNDL